MRLLSPRMSSSLPELVPPPWMGVLGLKSVSRHRASALPWRCFSAVRRQLLHPRPTAYPPVPSSPKMFNMYRPRLLIGRVSITIQPRKKSYRTDRAGDLRVGVRIIMNSKILRSRLSDNCRYGGSQLPVPVPTGTRVQPPPGPPPLHRRRAHNVFVPLEWPR
jgi:hypothetical protein